MNKITKHKLHFENESHKKTFLQEKLSFKSGEFMLQSRLFSQVSFVFCLQRQMIELG